MFYSSSIATYVPTQFLGDPRCLIKIVAELYCNCLHSTLVFLQLLAALTLNDNILYCQLRVLHLRGTSFIHSFIQSTYTRDIINAVLFAVKVHVE